MSYNKDDIILRYYNTNSIYNNSIFTKQLVNENNCETREINNINNAIINNFNEINNNNIEKANINEDEINNNKINNSEENNKEIKELEIFYEYYRIKKHEFPQVQLFGTNGKNENFWILTNKPKDFIDKFTKLYNINEIYITNSYFSRAFTDYRGQKIILLTKIPKCPYKFLNKLNNCINSNGRVLPSCRYSLIISNQVIIIILSDKSLDYINDSFLRYNKSEESNSRLLLSDLRNKFTELIY